MQNLGPVSELFVKNPHSILAALELRPKDVLEITLPKDKTDETWKKIEALAQKNKVRLKEPTAQRDEKPARGNDRPGGRNQRPNFKEPVKEFVGRESAHGAMIKPKASISIEEMFAGIEADTRGVWLALDTLQDPQNLGAIFRSAGFFGIRGIVLTAERSAPMSATVYDISCGGVESVPFVQVINLQRAFEVAKKSNLWILGTSEHAKDPIQKIKNDRPWLIVVGNEEKGIRRLTEEACDMMTVIPCRGNINGDKVVTSLNVSVATGVILSHFS